MTETQRMILIATNIDINGVMERCLNNEELYFRLLRKALDDNSFTMLNEAFAQRDNETIFFYSHTLKGICANLGFDTITEIIDPFVELFRDTRKDEILPQEEYVAATGMLERLKVAYSEVTKAITKVLDGPEA